MNRKIPRVAFASLVAGVASACGDDPSTAERVADGVCREYACEDPVDFAAYYDSIAQCTRILTAYYDDLFDDYRLAYGPACPGALADYEICDSRHDIQVCQSGSSAINCNDEYSRYIIECS